MWFHVNFTVAPIAASWDGLRMQKLCGLNFFLLYRRLQTDCILLHSQGPPVHQEQPFRRTDKEFGEVHLWIIFLSHFSSKELRVTFIVPPSSNFILATTMWGRLRMRESEWLVQGYPVNFYGWVVIWAQSLADSLTTAPSWLESNPLW